MASYYPVISVTATPSILGPPLIKFDASANPEAHVKDLNNCIIDIQAIAYSNAYKVKALELIPSNAARAPLPEGNLQN
ncbi:hypothetical protein DSO57_1021719 [Entomophthora muscae]|uniref:Uncharacterized protein n=1 Tax=Entomophthora muscae TaxID=34485 RepID=A0ACC2UD60_9FUNG|nr:hypothetical protein DSO57_1021719 [Entomophthora muscae]